MLPTGIDGGGQIKTRICDRKPLERVPLREPECLPEHWRLKDDTSVAPSPAKANLQAEGLPVDVHRPALASKAAPLQEGNGNRDPEARARGASGGAMTTASVANADMAQVEVKMYTVEKQGTMTRA